MPTNRQIPTAIRRRKSLRPFVRPSARPLSIKHRLIDRSRLNANKDIDAEEPWLMQLLLALWLMLLKLTDVDGVVNNDDSIVVCLSVSVLLSSRSSRLLRRQPCYMDTKQAPTWRRRAFTPSMGQSRTAVADQAKRERQVT